MYWCDKYVLEPADEDGDDGLLQLVEAQEAGASPQTADQYGMTALHHAARFGHQGIVMYLLEQGLPVPGATSR